MKKLVLILTCIMGTTMIAQESIEKKIGEFNEIKVYDLIEVNLINAEIDKVVISGKNTDDVVVVNKNGKLKIRMNLEETFDGDETTVDVYYTNIDVIDANEGAIISSKSKIKQFEIDLKAQEGGKISVDLEVNYTNVKSVSGGQIKAMGTSKSQAVSISTGGAYMAKDLVTESTNIVIKAAGEAHINATDVADVKVRAGGSVYVYGGTNTIKEDKVFGGKIKRMN
jgi:hypothetical protein